MTFTEKLKKALTQPAFFKEIRKESLAGSFIFLTIFALISYLYLTLYYIDQINEALAAFDISIQLTLLNFLIWYLAFVAFFLVMSIFRFFFIHLFVRLFKGKAGYKETYKSLSYSVAPNYYTMPLFILLLIGYASSMLLFYIILPLYIIAVIYTIYLRSTALSNTQKIGFWKALLSIYVFGTILQLIAIVLIEIMILVIYFAMM